MPTLNISYSSLIRVVLVLLGLAFLYVINDIILILFLSIILASALDPWVSWFERRHFPRSFGIVVVYLLLFMFISIIGVALAPAISSQAKILANNFPNYYDRLITRLNVDVGRTATGNIEGISKAINSLAGNIIPAVRGIFGGGFTIFLILVLTFYLSVEDRGLKRFFRSILPVNYQPYFARIMNRIQDKMGHWLRGQLLLCAVVFLMTAIGLSILHLFTDNVPYWLVLAFIAGLLEVVPFLGPFVAGALAVLLVIGNSFWVALIVVALYLLIQQLENHILVPKIMQKSVGLNPIVIILVIVIGVRLAGILGALVAIPIAATIQVFLKDVLQGEKNPNLRTPD